MKPNNLFILGVTGGVGTGKSTVLSMLAEEGFFVIRADDVAKDLEKPGQKAFEALRASFGNAILSKDGEIDRKRFAEVIFGDPEALKKVNNIVHPLVKNEILVMIKEEAQKGRRCFAVEAALFLEAGYADFSHKILFVRADEEVRRARLKASRHYSDEKITAIMGAQKEEAFYASAADFVIDNSGLECETRKAVKEITDRVF